MQLKIKDVMTNLRAKEETLNETYTTGIIDGFTKQCTPEIWSVWSSILLQ